MTGLSAPVSAWRAARVPVCRGGVASLGAKRTLSRTHPASTGPVPGVSVPAFMQDIEDIFGAEGPLARHLPGFTSRPSQQAMAVRVAETVAERGSLMVEAGTGTGKTFAYLVPAILAGVRVLVSTGTRTLQDQLFSKDVPLVAGALGLGARTALLKGRSNYLCLERLSRQLSQRVLDGMAGPDAMLGRIEKWSKSTRSGDLAEVTGLTDAHPVWSQVTSTRDNCLGQRCPDYGDCHVVAARREAQEADLVIVNHHLLLADLALKEDGFGDILGTADAVILDEAHQIPDLATQFFGQQASSRQVEVLLAEVRAGVTRAGASMAEFAPVLRSVESAINATLAALRRDGNRIPWEECGADLESFTLALADALQELAERLGGASHEASLAQCAKRATALAEALQRIARCSADDGVRTVECSGRSFSVGLLPFDVAERFASLMGARRAAWVFTSATLSVGTDFSHFAVRLGLEAVPTLQIPSPYDFDRQALLYLPEGLPEPTSPSHTEAVVAAAMPLLDASRGGAFILFTSHRALSRAAALLRERWDGAADYPLLVQGEGPRERLLTEFREHGSAVLLGTTSFWEGVDVKGDALRLVIIEKLPFASPDEPLVKSRIDFLRRRGGNPFKEYQLPGAVLALKQGVGRLIRSEEDRGLIAICDPRLVSKSYGRVFLRSLPDMPVTRDPREAGRFLAAIARQGSTAPVAPAASGPVAARP